MDCLSGEGTWTTILSTSCKSSATSVCEGCTTDLSFGYADQTWDSKSKENQCKRGKFDHGSSQGDCGFNCALPRVSPLSSATNTMSPTRTTLGQAGYETFSNTFTTFTTATSARSGSPRPTYATGECSFHLTQYQKHERKSNPTSNYMCEATIFDARKTPTAESAVQQFSGNTWVDVTGLVSNFSVMVQNTDNDPIKFRYGTQQWDSKSKVYAMSVGKYDSGKREMDGQFSCNP